ncbi:MAG: PhnD/SsuA/transferrin family substrate-binding protein [Candidatus Thiodiazotropha sp.]
MKLHRTHPVMLRVLQLLLFYCLPVIWIPALADEVRIGVLAKRGYDISLAKWNATAEYLNQSLPQHRFRIVPMKFDDIPVIVKNQLVDFVIVNPGIYVNLSVKYGVQRILTLINGLSSDTSSTKFGSVIFSLNSHKNLQYLSDIANHRVAAVHQTSLGGWIMALREMHNAGIETWELSSLTFLGTHDAVVEAVLNRDADIGIVRTDTLEHMAHEGKVSLNQLRIIDPRVYPRFPYAVSTPLYAEWPFSQLSHTPQQLAKEVSIALLQLTPDHPAAKQAHIRGWTTPENYQAVRDLLLLLELPPYDQPFGQRFTESLQEHWFWYLPLPLAFLFMIGMSLRIMRLNHSLSEHKRNLKRSQEAQIATFEQAAVGLAHITASGQLLDMNRRLVEITGHSMQTLKQINLKEMIYDEDLAPVTETFDRLRQGLQQNASLQFRLLSADGTMKWCQLTLSYKPVNDQGENYFIAVIDAINRYQALEAENLQSQHQTELILNMAGEGILGLDSEGKHTFVNATAASLLGYEVEEMLHRPSHQLWHHSYRDGSHYPSEACPITSVFKHGQIQRCSDETFWRKDGSPIQVDWISTPIQIDGNINGAVVLFRPCERDGEIYTTTPSTP